MELKDVELRGADRVCAVAITVLEPGQSAKTVYRGFRLPRGRKRGPRLRPGLCRLLPAI